MKKYTTILFDLDGTLTDPGEGIINSVEYALNKFGITVDDKKSLAKFIGPPLLVSFSTYYGFDEEKSRKAIEIYREYYKDKGINECKLFDGIRELLESLKNAGYEIALATSLTVILLYKCSCPSTNLQSLCPTLTILGACGCN